MADYHSPTTVQPDIPIATMTALERRLLCELFEFEHDDSTYYFFASENVADTAWIDMAELRALLDDDDDRPSAIAQVVRAELASADPADQEFELDFSLIGYDRIFQDIVRRSPDLDHVQIVAAWTCTRMRPDGFGGMATVITADAVESMSTTSFIEEVLARLAEP
jgi:hypothetical protein